MTENNKKMGAASKLTPPPTPRTPRAAESTAERGEHAGKTLLLLAAGDDRRKMLTGVKKDREQQKTRCSVKTYPPPTPRTLRAAESFAKRAEHAGRTLLLLLVPVENHNNNNNKNPAQGRRLTPSFYPAPPAKPNPLGRTNEKCC